MDSTSKPDAQSGQSGITRRSVAKTAAHAAWAVPAIQVAAAVPAFAAASDILQITSATGTWGQTLFGEPFINVNIKIKNNSPDDATQGLVVTLTFPTAYGTVGTNQYGTGSVASGWTIGASGRTITFTRTGAQLTPGQEATITTSRQPILGANPTGADPAITVTATSAGGFSSASSSFVPA